MLYRFHELRREIEEIRTSFYDEERLLVSATSGGPR
jgi:hypothetical protein